MDTATKLFKVSSTSLLQLQQLVIVGDVHEAFLDGKSWEQILEHYVPSLKCFQFRFCVTNENNWKYIECHYGEWISIDLDPIISSFKNEFWLEKHQWFVYSQTNDETTILYTLPCCEPYSLHLTTALSTHENYRAQITSPILPYNRLDRYYFSNIRKLSLKIEIEIQNIVELLSNVLNLTSVQQLELTYPAKLNQMVFFSSFHVVPI
ncbi:unnamed protein product [Rotaria socialis]|uniref:Uncharacterized protein n=1 Tax=Rotaria socialis TaxID=392032 RepID=A0A817XP93_9BILA|nr:unnamed protein product [Rotaria socialis]